MVAVIALSSARHLCAQIRQPFQLLDDEPEDVYLPAGPPTPRELTNQGGVNFSLEVDYASHYIFRGVDQSTPPKRNENALQFNSRLDFNLGKLPHPFIGVFSNIFYNDPVSRFEEVRPYAGAEWTIRPITVAGGFTSYIFPNREGKDTQEVWVRISGDDSRLWHSERPVLTPYIYGAYDFHKYDGFYLEAGLKHDFIIGETGLVLTAVGDLAYVVHDPYFRNPGPVGKETGFQHYDCGMIATYDLNPALGIPQRFGQWQVRGYLMYSGSVSEGLRADSRIWGGIGLSFRY